MGRPSSLILAVFALLLLTFCASALAKEFRVGQKSDAADVSSLDSDLASKKESQNFLRYAADSPVPVTIVPLNESDPAAINPGCTCSCCTGTDCELKYAGFLKLSCSQCVPSICPKNFPLECPNSNQNGKSAVLCVNGASGLMPSSVFLAASVFIATIAFILV